MKYLFLKCSKLTHRSSWNTILEFFLLLRLNEFAWLLTVCESFCGGVVLQWMIEEESWDIFIHLSAQADTNFRECGEVPSVNCDFASLTKFVLVLGSVSNGDQDSLMFSSLEESIVIQQRELYALHVYKLFLVKVCVPLRSSCEFKGSIEKMRSYYSSW